MRLPARVSAVPRALTATRPSRAWPCCRYRLALRATQGLLSSVLRLLKVALPVPDYTTWCRRRQQLAVSLLHCANAQPLHMVVDATGIKVYGEGEWKGRRHGWSKRRTQAAKLHWGVDEASGELGAAAVTTHELSDGQLLPELLDKIDAHRPGRVMGRMIRRRAMRRSINARRAQPSRRSLAETAAFRVKTLFGDQVRAHTFPAQGAQLLIRCRALNRMTHLGMPDSYTR
jgi:hypothetical protein